MVEVLDAYETPLLRYAAGILRDPTAAQDVVQNVMTKLFRHWQPGMRPDARLKGWLYRATHHAAVDLIRRESRRSRLHHAYGKFRETCADGTHCEEAGAESRHERVLRLLPILAPSEQQVLLLRLQQGLSYARIAEITGRSTGNVGSLLHHAVRKLARAVQKEEGEEELGVRGQGLHPEGEQPPAANT